MWVHYKHFRLLKDEYGDKLMNDEDSEHFMELYKKGSTLYDEKRFEEALTVFLELVQFTESIIKKYSNPEKRDSRLLEIYESILPRVGFCLIEFGRNDEALVYYMKAYSIAKELVAEKDFANSKYDLACTADIIGNHLVFLGRHNEALKYYRVGMKTLKQLFDDCYLGNDAKQMFADMKKSYNEALAFSNASDDQSRLYYFIDEDIDEMPKE